MKMKLFFLLSFKIKDANKKIITDINIEYLICKEICIPKNVKRKINFSLKKMIIMKIVLF